MSKKISVSFKNTKKEQEIYNYFNDLEETGFEIKKILLKWYNENMHKDNHTKNEFELKSNK